MLPQNWGGWQIIFLLSYSGHLVLMSSCSQRTNQSMGRGDTLNLFHIQMQEEWTWITALCAMPQKHVNNGNPAKVLTHPTDFRRIRPTEM